MIHKNRQAIKRLPILVKIVMVVFIAFVVYSIINLALHAVVMLIGITIISIFINNIVDIKSLKLNRIAEDFTSPLVQIPIFAASSFIYLLFPEVTILLAFLIIPQVFGELVCKFDEYLQELNRIAGDKPEVIP